MSDTIAVHPARISEYRDNPILELTDGRTSLSFGRNKAERLIAVETEIRAFVAGTYPAGIGLNGTAVDNGTFDTAPDGPGGMKFREVKARIITANYDAIRAFVAGTAIPGRDYDPDETPPTAPAGAALHDPTNIIAIYRARNERAYRTPARAATPAPAAPMDDSLLYDTPAPAPAPTPALTAPTPALTAPPYNIMVCTYRGASPAIHVTQRYADAPALDPAAAQLQHARDLVAFNAIFDNVTPERIARADAARADLAALERAAAGLPADPDDPRAYVITRDRQGAAIIARRHPALLTIQADYADPATVIGYCTEAAARAALATMDDPDVIARRAARVQAVREQYRAGIAAVTGDTAIGEFHAITDEKIEAVHAMMFQAATHSARAHDLSVAYTDALQLYIAHAADLPAEHARAYIHGTRAPWTLTARDMSRRARERMAGSDAPQSGWMLDTLVAAAPVQLYTLDTQAAAAQRMAQHALDVFQNVTPAPAGVALPAVALVEPPAAVAA